MEGLKMAIESLLCETWMMAPVLDSARAGMEEETAARDIVEAMI